MRRQTSWTRALLTALLLTQACELDAHIADDLREAGDEDAGAERDSGSSGVMDAGSGSKADAGSHDAGAGTCECSGPRPLSPNVTCADGSQGGPLCTRHANGTCGWEVRVCPSTVCPALGCNPKCPSGVLKDENGCDTCQCAPDGSDAGASDPCAGKKCGDVCSTCLPNGACVQIIQFCDAQGACGTSVDPMCPAPAGLHWYSTCGSPVCGIEPPDTALAACGSIREGDTCAQENATCDPGVACGAKLRCAAKPIDTSNCPISSQKYKSDIRYLETRDLEKLAHSVQSIKLATYHYKDQKPEEQKHLGFIIEDDPNSPAVFTSRERVDLYGYASMAVAALQVQEHRIRELERELSQLRAQVGVREVPAMCGASEP